MGIKIWAYVALAGIVVGAATWGYNAIYDAGYDAAVIKMIENQQIAVDKAVKEARTQWELSADAAQSSLDDENKIEEDIRDVESNIPAAVDSVDPACRDLGADVFGVFNDAISAGNNEEPDAADPAVTDEEM